MARMDSVLGYTVGNWLEVRKCVETFEWGNLTRQGTEVSKLGRKKLEKERAKHAKKFAKGGGGNGGGKE